MDCESIERVVADVFSKVPFQSTFSATRWQVARCYNVTYQVLVTVRPSRRRLEAIAVRPMLLIIDMLNDFLDDWSTTDRASLVEGVRLLTEMFRAARQPIVWVRQEFEPDLSDAFQEMRRKTFGSL